jgi:uncharacterized membrane protein YkvA (DUF1232 family)
MYAQTSLSPLSPALLNPLVAATDRPARRRRVGNFPLEAAALDHFNDLLARLHHVPLLGDQLATAARDLARQPVTAHRAAAITQRVRLAHTVSQMLADPEWEPASEAMEPAQLVVNYTHGPHRLIPDNLPVIGRLDDAVVVDAAWPQLAGEVDSYLDYRRLRDIEAKLRHCRVFEFHFSRQEWQQARQAEAALIEHCRRVGASSYVPASTSASFRVY